ncbi:hypothetical protein [Pseudomonas veronii]
MAYNTGNPVEPNGSSDPRDLIDNAKIADKLINSSDLTWPGRLGKALKTWAGITQQVTDYLIAQGYESVYLVYGVGVIVQRQTQLVQRDGELYRVMNAQDIPLTLTGTWSTDSPKLQAVGDAALRQALADSFNPDAGAALVGRATVALSGVFDLQTARKAEDLLYEVKSYYRGGRVGGGLFQWSPSTPKSQHNGWRIIDPSISWDGLLASLGSYLTAAGGSGSGCFIRTFDGTASPEMAGAIADWNGTTGTNCSVSVQALINDASVAVIRGSGGAYWFGQFAANQVKFRISRNVAFDWCWSKLVCRGEASLADSSGALFVFEDCNARFGRYIFEDTSFTFLIGGRGIQPVTLVSLNKTTSGHHIGPCHVVGGQSILTVAPAGSQANRTNGIRLIGPCTADKVYYGINCANNGDDLSGEYSIGEVNRALFVYGVSDVDVKFNVTYGWPASANIYLSQYGSSVKATSGIKVKAHFGSFNGPFLIASDSTKSGAGEFRDIDLDVTFDALGTDNPSSIGPSLSIFRMGCYNPASPNSLMTELGTVITDNIKIRLNPGPSVSDLGSPIQIYTPSQNHGKWTITEDTPYEITRMFPVDAAGTFGTPVFYRGGRGFKAVHGSLTSTGRVVRIPATYLAPRKTNHEFTIKLRVSARNGVGATTATKMSEYLLLGFVDSSGNGILRVATQVATVDYGTPAATFTVAMSTDQKFLEVSATGYTGSLSDLVASFDFV